MEGLAAGTHIRLLPSVCPEVALEALLGGITAITMSAPERFLLGVLGQLVSPQIFPRCHRLTTYLTHQLDITGAMEALPVGTQVTHAQEC